MSDTFHRLLYHVVFATRDRTPLITESLREDLYRYIGGIVRHEGGALLEIGGVADHVHLLVGMPPRRAVADWVRLVKAGSSKWSNEQRRNDRFGWQAGYGAFSVGGSTIDAVRRYVRRQDAHHRRLSHREEVEALCRAAGIAVPDSMAGAR